MNFVGLKASITKGREIETQAGKKNLEKTEEWQTRR
jgi:hypothetical protein